jgi:predicted Zn-dependent protease with MMP-like domain
MRGPGVAPTAPGRPALRTGRERFDDIVVSVVADIERRWHHRLGLVEYVVEEVPPPLPAHLAGTDDVPLASAVPARGDRPARLVVYRQPIEHRAEGRQELGAIVLTVVVEQVAELLGLSPGEVDARYLDEE